MMENVRKRGNNGSQKEKADRTATPSVSVITENNGEYSLFLYPLNKGNIQKICFKTPDRCAGTKTEISPVFLNMLTETQKGIFKKNTVVGTVFITDNFSEKHLIPLDEATEDQGEGLYFGIDRRSLVTRLTTTRISFEKAMFIDISSSKREVFFCVENQVISVFPMAVPKEALSPADAVFAMISGPSEILDLAEKFAPDALFISVPSLTEKDINRISKIFDKKERLINTTLFFQTVDNSELALFEAKILACKRQKALITDER